MNIKTYEEIILLYELALAAGGSNDLQQSMNKFIHALMTKKSIDFCSIWFKDCIVDTDSCISDCSCDNASTYKIIYATPKALIKETTLPVDHPSFNLGGANVLSICSNDPEFSQYIAEKHIETGSFAILRLQNLGYIKMHSQHIDSLPERDLHQLMDVIDQFAVTLSGAIAHQCLKAETIKLKNTEEDLLAEQIKLRHQADYLISMNADLEVEAVVRKQSQKELEMTQLELKQLNSTLEEAAVYLMTDTECKIIHASPQYCERSQYQPRELTSKTYAFNEPANETEQQLVSSLAEGVTWYGCSRHTNKEGHQFWATTVIIPFQNPQGETVKHMILLSDIVNVIDADQQSDQIINMRLS